jgi:hypothetical protein
LKTRLKAIRRPFADHAGSRPFRRYRRSLPSGSIVATKLTLLALLLYAKAIRPSAPGKVADAGLTATKHTPATPMAISARLGISPTFRACPAQSDYAGEARQH